MSVWTEPAPVTTIGRRPRITLTDGIAFLGRPELAQRQSGPAGLAAAHPDLLTVAIGVEDGGFVIEFDGGGSESCDGAELAAVLPPVPLYDADVRMCLDWPEDRNDRARLRYGLRALAESTGATVWAPPEGGRTRIAAACRDLAAVDGDGEPAVWQAFQPDVPAIPRYVSDADGRLLPAGGLVLTGRPGVPLISVSAARPRDTTDRYRAVRPRARTFLIDLPVLDDGRLAAWCQDGTLFALGPRHLAHLIEARGWLGEDVLLLADLTPEHAARLARYVRAASAALGRELPIMAGAPRPANTVEMFHTNETTHTSGTTQATARLIDIVKPRTAPEPDPLEPDPYEDRYGPDPTLTTDWTPAAVFLARPDLVTANRRAGRHGLPWLPELPQVNDEEFDVYVHSAWAPERVAVDGIPSPRLFLVGHLGAGEAGPVPPVRVRVRPHGAIDVMASGVKPPAEFAALLAETDAYVLPAHWLDRCRVMLDAGSLEAVGILEPARLLADAGRLDDAGTPVPATLSLAGAAHGIDGLPEDAQVWPSRWRAHARAYAILPDPMRPDTAGGGDGETHGEAGGSLRLYRNRPGVRPGRLVELQIGTGLAIDIAHTARDLDAPSTVRSILPELRSAGVEFLLPRNAFDRVRVTALFVPAGRVWRPSDLPPFSPLESLLER